MRCRGDVRMHTLGIDTNKHLPPQGARETKGRAPRHVGEAKDNAPPGSAGLYFFFEDGRRASKCRCLYVHVNIHTYDKLCRLGARRALTIEIGIGIGTSSVRPQVSASRPRGARIAIRFWFLLRS